MSEQSADEGEAPVPGMTPEQARERGYRLIIMGGRLCSHCEHCRDSGLCGVLNMDVSLAQAAECDTVKWFKRAKQAVIANSTRPSPGPFICGHISRGNRKTQERFQCEACGRSPHWLIFSPRVRSA